jgi:uncharacterized protein
MIIDLRTISHDVPARFELHLDKGWWHQDNNDDQIIGVSNPITAVVEIYRSGNKYVLEGKMTGSLKIRCDRCLNAYDKEINTDFKLFLSRPSHVMNKGEIELLEEDMETGFINDDEINLDDIFKEQLYLSLPIKSLCKEECLGLCPICGTDLNMQTCQCRN